MKRIGAPAVIVVALLGLWELAAQWHLVAGALNLEPYLVPAPSDVATSLWSDRSLLATDGWVTLREILFGFGLALIAGLLFAVMLHLSDLMRRAFYPLLVASQTIPIVALAPILVIWFGYGITAKLIIIAVICFFPITVNTLDGLRTVDPEAVKMLRTLDASRWQRFIRLEAPTALPYAFSGAKIAAAVTAIAAVFGELAGSERDGLGNLISQANAQLLTARLFAAVVVLALFAVSLFAILALIERRIVTWKQ